MLITENWMTPAGTSMLGMGRTVKAGVTADYEFMRIEIRGTDYYFVAQPKANATETAFKLTSSQPTLAVFEDPTHDFPQKIGYQLTKPNELSAWIEGVVKGKTKRVDFLMQRAKCS